MTSLNDVMRVKVRDASNGNNNRLTCDDDDNEAKLDKKTAMDIEMI